MNKDPGDGPSRAQTPARAEGGRKDALDHLMPQVYDELRRLAASFLRGERAGHTLQPTALVNEAYMRLVDQRAVTWESRAQFFGLAAQMMRRVLVDHARTRGADKRGGGAARITLDPSHSVTEDRTVEILAVNGAIEKLASFDPQKAHLVELRMFAGLTMDEAAEVLGRSRPSLERDWRVARAFLQEALGP